MRLRPTLRNKSTHRGGNRPRRPRQGHVHPKPLRQLSGTAPPPAAAGTARVATAAAVSCSLLLL